MRGYLKKQKTALGNIAGSGLEVVYEQTDTSDLRPHECQRIQLAHGTKQGGRAARQRMAHGAAHRQSSHHQSGRRHTGLPSPAQSEGAGDQHRGSCLQQRIWHGRGAPASTRLSEGHCPGSIRGQEGGVHPCAISAKSRFPEGNCGTTAKASLSG